METKNVKVPWKTLRGMAGSGDRGDLVKINDEWLVLCLRIGSPRQGRWYARKSDGTQWSISVRRATEVVYHRDWDTDTIYNYKARLEKNRRKPAPHQEQRKAWSEVLEAGEQRAHEIRDRISTRRANTIARRGGLGLGGW